MFHGLEYKGNLGTAAPLVITFTASKSFSRSVDVTKAYDMTLLVGEHLYLRNFTVPQYE
jgi:hypothetical protein